MDLDADNPLAIEIRQEVAEAYFAACKKMVASIETLKAFDRPVASSTLDGGQIGRRAELLEDACERIYFVVIQREAMNLPCFEEFFKDYEIPDEVRMRLGPRREKSEAQDSFHQRGVAVAGSKPTAWGVSPDLTWLK